jgi:hypothetical protein
MMNTAICTLFEGDYHYGLAALANSAYASGFRGTIWAGYRGRLPFWANPLIPEAGWDRYQAADGLDIRFIRLDTEYVFFNYKPDLMLNLWENKCPEADFLFFFDADIVIRCPWSYFETWAKAGIALCEDVNSPLSRTHPLRFQWSAIYAKYGYQLRFDSDQYANSGFLGVMRPHKAFVKEWQAIQRIMGQEIGGLNKLTKDVGREDAFSKPDQDALNIAMALTKQPLSIMGKEGMDFANGGFTMSHCIGHLKPWNTNFIKEAFLGYSPSVGSKRFFASVSDPISTYSPLKLKQKLLSVSIASAIGRFNRRS